MAKQAADLCTGALDQRIVYEVWKRGVMAARLPALRGAITRKDGGPWKRRFGARWAACCRGRTPKGGFFLWTAFPDGIDTDAMLARAIAHRVVYVAGSAFFVEGRTRHRHLARLCFSATTPEQIDEGIRRLAAAVREELASQQPQGSVKSPTRM